MSLINDFIKPYETAFEEYIANRKITGNIAQDPLMLYLKEVLDDYSVQAYWLDDDLLRESLKSSLLDFFQLLSQYFQQIEKKKRTEYTYLQSIGESKNLERKEELWDQISDYLAKEYAPSDFNAKGYDKLLKQKEIDKETIYEGLCKNWQAAYHRKIEHEKKQLLNYCKKYFEQQAIQAGNNDYKMLSTFHRIYLKYEPLHEIVKCMGREKENSNKLKNEITNRYMPDITSCASSNSDIEGVKEGDDLQSLMSLEVALLSDHSTEELFLMKYATKRLQLFSGRSDKIKPKKSSKKKPQKRLQKGPMILSVDTSGSMSGRPEKIAKSLIMEILQIAKREKRKCFLISFAVRTQTIDIADYGNWNEVKKFLTSCFTGGTDGENMLKACIKTLQEDSYEMADILIISDFCFNYCLPNTEKQIREEQNKGTRFYGLQLRTGKNYFNKLLDKTWEIKL